MFPGFLDYLCSFYVYAHTHIILHVHMYIKIFSRASKNNRVCVQIGNVCKLFDMQILQHC